MKWGKEEIECIALHASIRLLLFAPMPLWRWGNHIDRFLGPLGLQPEKHVDMQ